MFKKVEPGADFPALERELLDHWYKDGIIKRYLEKNKESGIRYSFLDGPITANNPMGVHHAWGRTYKDFWQRFYNMCGYCERFQNGFDEQGLWVEVEVEKELSIKTKKDIENLIPGDKFKSLEKFINLCKERVKKYSQIQTEQSKRLGYFMDWENSYHTSSDKNNYEIWNFLKVVNENGWLYKGRDSVPWCPRCGTAISQHEILTEEYKELTHRTVVFKLPIKGKDKEFLLAWTTTPWTIPGNVALAVDPDINYLKITNDSGEKVIIINPDPIVIEDKNKMLVNKLKLLEGWTKIEDIKGKNLIGLEYEGSFDNLPAVKKALGNYIHRVVSSDPLILPINPEEGTGIVHIAPGAGTEDFQLGKKEKLPAVEEIDESGIFLDGFEFLSGLSVKEASKMVLEDLVKRNLAYKVADYTHRYPTCWRCKTELVWRVVNEWYIAMDVEEKSKVKSQKSKFEGKTYREQMVEVVKKINWLPKWGLDRELDWLSNMHDWLISKKRYWGLALPIWECKKCHNFEVIGSYSELKARTVEGWGKFEGNSPHRPWIDQVKIKCTKCSNTIDRISDVGNPWLDAGIVSISTMPSDWFPADFITESFPGQFKNWFYSLIAMGTALKQTNPFKTVLGFASVRDEKGEEMHKSKGNSIEFNEAADKIGVDVMRWMFLKTNPENNLNFGPKTADEIRRYFHIRFWNVYGFFVLYANIDNSKPSENSFKPVHVLDKWILSRLNSDIESITKSIEKYDAGKAVEVAEKFVVDDLSNWYVRRIRERVGPTAVNINDKNDAYQTLWLVLVTYSKLLAPFIPFITETIYTNLTGQDSVHLADWPKSRPEFIDSHLETEVDTARKLVELIHSKRKEQKIKVRQPLKSCRLSSNIIISDDLLRVVKDEVNVKNIYLEKKQEITLVEIDLNITPELKLEGEMREIVRKIQDERKKLGTNVSEQVDVYLDTWPVEFEAEIKRRALVREIIKNENFSVVRLNE